MSSTRAPMPKSNEDVFRHHYKLAKYLVQKAGIHEQDAEDIAATIITVFIEKDVLSDFDPTYQGAGHSRPVDFTNFFSSFVLTYVKHHVHRQRKLAHREPYDLNAPTTGDLTFFDFLESQDLTPRSEDPSAGIEYEDFVVGMRRTLAEAKLPVNSVDPLQLFDLMQKQVEQTGAIYQKELAEILGVRQNLISKNIAVIRRTLAAYRLS